MLLQQTLYYAKFFFFFLLMNIHFLGLNTYCSLVKKINRNKKFTQPIKIFYFSAKFTMATNLTQIISLLNISKLKKRHNQDTNTKQNLKTNQIIIKKKKIVDLCSNPSGLHVLQQWGRGRVAMDRTLIFVVLCPSSGNLYLFLSYCSLFLSVIRMK